MPGHRPTFDTTDRQLGLTTRFEMFGSFAGFPMAADGQMGSRHP